MRPKLPLSMEGCTREELFDARITSFLVNNREPAKSFKGEGVYCGRLSAYFKVLRNYCYGKDFHYDKDFVFEDQKNLEKFFYAFFRGVFKQGSCASKHFVHINKIPDFLFDGLIGLKNGRYIILTNNIESPVFMDAFLTVMNFKK